MNSEEGAPMGVGVRGEMVVMDPVAYLFKNSDPRGSLLANVSNATVRCLSNMKLERMLEERHEIQSLGGAEGLGVQVIPGGSELLSQLSAAEFRPGR